MPNRRRLKEVRKPLEDDNFRAAISWYVASNKIRPGNAGADSRTEH
jgi:hypothetical protein